jgi:dTDP-4-dehydrorhamnose 3,5-epimerase
MIQGVIIKKLEKHPDERGFFEELVRHTDPVFEGEKFGQLSHSRMHVGVVKAWHVHKTQIDWWFVLTGTIKAVLYDTRKNSDTFKEIQEFVLGEKGEDIMIRIPPGVAHGLKVLEGPSDLIYVTSSIYKIEEEGRIPYDDSEIGYDWVQGMEITNINIT